MGKGGVREGKVRVQVMCSHYSPGVEGGYFLQVHAAQHLFRHMACTNAVLQSNIKPNRNWALELICYSSRQQECFENISAIQRKLN